MKRILSVIICLVMICPCISLAYTDAESENEIALERYVSYANSIIPDLMNLPDVTLPSTDLYISQPIEIYGENDGNTCAVFMFDQNTCIGILLISYVTDSFYASFLHSEMPTISAAYTNSTPFYLLSSNGALLMCATTTEIIVGKTEENKQTLSTLTQYQADETYTSIQREVLTLTLVSPTNSQRMFEPPYSSATLDVPFVENTTVNSKGLCWAAGAASIIRFLKGTAVSALDVYNAAATVGPPPTGTPENILKGLYYYGVQNYLSKTSAISFVNCTLQIDAGYPVLLSIIGTSYTLPAYHAVVVCGYLCESDGTDYIQILDSNVPEGKIWLTVDRDTNAFVYNANFATTYTSWGWSVCAYLDE